MDYLFVIKWLHILSSTVLFGTGLGTAFFLWSAHLTGNAGTIASVARITVRADWLFTATSGVVQPLTGLALALGFGHDLTSRWLVWTYVLYGVALLCWLPVVKLQIEMRNLALQAASEGTPLPERYHRAARTWFILGWPAFISLLAVFWLMVARPV
jgi:uncharacterized membrane protein